MRFYSTGIITALLLLLAGAVPLHAQVELQRISTTERADGLGFVVRYHLTQLPDSFRVSQPDENRVEMVLFSMDLNTEQMIPVQFPSQIENIDLYNLLSGIGMDIYFAEGEYFVANAYPDVNGRDVLLSLRFATQDEVRTLADIVTTEVPEEEPYEHAEDVPEISEPAAPPRTAERSRAMLPVTFGVQAGVSYSNLYNASFNRDTRSGMTFGFSITADLPYRLPFNITPSVQTGVHYTQKGFDNPSARFDGVAIEFDYIEVPAIGKFSYSLDYGISPHVLFGPYVAFMVSAERVRENGSRRDLDDSTRDVDFGWIGGAGVDFKVGDTTLQAQARGALSFSDLQKGEFSEGEKHVYMAFVLGFRF